MSVVWSLSGVIAYTDGSVKGFEVVKDRQQSFHTGPDVSTHPKIVKIFRDLELPTKAAIEDPLIKDIKFRFSILDALTNNVTVEIGGTDNYIIKDTFYDEAHDLLSVDPFFLASFADFTGCKFDGTYYLENRDGFLPYGYSEVSMFCWIKPSPLALGRFLACIGVGTRQEEDEISLVINPDSSFVAYANDALVSSLDYRLKLNHWNFIGLVYDKEYVSLYVNGVLLGQAPAVLNLANELFRVGYGFALVEYLNFLHVGDISHVSVYNRAVNSDPQFVAKLYELGRVNYSDIPEDQFYGYTLSPFESSKSIDSVEALNVAHGGINALQVYSGGSLSTLNVHYVVHTVETVLDSDGDPIEFSTFNNESGLLAYWNLEETQSPYIDSVNDHTLERVEIGLDFYPKIAMRGTEVKFTPMFNVPVGQLQNFFYESERYTWQFDDSTISNERLPKRFYRREGVFDVSLTLVDSFTIKDTITIAKPRHVEPMDGTKLKGTLVSDAVYFNDYIRFTTDHPGLTGGIRYSSFYYPLSDQFIVDFDMYADGTADAVYFYFGCLDHPLDENLGIGGYVVYFSEYNNRCGLVYNQDLIDSSNVYNLGNGTWRHVRIIYSHNRFIVSLNNEKVLDVIDEPRTLRYTAWGLGGRTGYFSAEHRVRQLSVSY